VFGFEWVGADGVCSTIEIMGDEEPSAKVKAAAKKREHQNRLDGRDESALVTLEQARQQVLDEEAEAARLALRRMRVRDFKDRKVRKYRQFSLFSAGPILGIDVARDRKKAAMEPATRQQLDVLAGYGMHRATGLDRATADKVIAECMERDFRRLADPETVRKLINAGLAPEDARALRPEEARERLAASERPSKGLESWLRQQGYRREQVESMTRREAGRIYGQWKARQRAGA
jgi:hypothetical protein